jgi:hypothetical protein
VFKFWLMWKAKVIVWSEILTAMSIKTGVFWGVMVTNILIWRWR